MSALAEAALGHAVASGASTIKSAETEANARLREQLSLQADLRDAVARGELYLAYQPQAELASGRILGAEALLRWEHPERGTIFLGVFIPMLEDSGLIDSVGQWVVAEAAQQARAWLDRGHALRVAVNLSEGLGLGTVAEGIETPTQQRFLQELGCRCGQGFGLGRPMRAEQLTCLLESPSEGPN